MLTVVWKRKGCYKVSKFVHTTRIMGQLSNVQKQTWLQVYNTLAMRTVLHDSGTWALKEQDKSRITTAEMKFVRKTSKYRLFDDRRNQELMKELETQPVLEKVNNYKHEWIQHVAEFVLSPSSIKFCYRFFLCHHVRIMRGNLHKCSIFVFMKKIYSRRMEQLCK
jgi:hypothetical protein